jgi:signal transduction histidine kinase
MHTRLPVASVRDVQVKERGAALLEQLRQMPPWRLDFVLATLFVLTGIATTARPEPSYEPRDAVAVGLVLAATVPYYLRRLAPLLVFVLAITATAALYILDYDAGGLPFVVAAGAYTVAAHRPLREVIAAAAYMYAWFVVMWVADNPGFGPAEFVTSVPLFGAVMAAGRAMQMRRLRAEALERDHGEAAERAAADERLRIAQELHDVIGHSLGVIAVQAGVGMHLIDTDSAEAKRTLEHISRTSRSSLAEIRRLLGLVRSGEGGATYAPTPGLADLSRLADDVTDTGLPVSLSVAADAHDLPPGVELAAYRIVQEALTNTRNHAHAHRATVELAVNNGALHIVVTDDGTGASSNNGSGHGLVGMRERVAVYGGSLDVGPAPDGGFRVSATLPYEELA